ncbi:mCG1033197, partial [Mus musculus]
KMSPPEKLCGSCQEGGRPSGAEDGATQKLCDSRPSQKRLALCIPHGHPCSLPSAESRSQEGSRRRLCHKPLRPGRPPCSHQEGGRLSGAEDGAAQKLCDSRPSQKRLALCIPHGHPCSLPSVESRSQEGSRRRLCHKPLRPGRPPCSHQEGGRLSGAEDGAAQKLCDSRPSQKRLALCIPHGHPCSLPSAESRSQEGSRRRLCHKPLRPGRPPCSHQEGGWLSGAEDGAAQKLCDSRPSQKRLALCIPHGHPCSLPSTAP